MNAPVTIGGLKPAQADALHMGPNAAMPHDPLALVLYGRCGQDPKIGFQAGALINMDADPCCRLLMLSAAPGAERKLIETSGSFGGLKPPTNVAVTASGDLYLADRANALIKYFDPCDCMFKPLPCFGSLPVKTSQPPLHRYVPLDRLNDPVGLAISGTELLIADRGNHRVVLVGLIGTVPRAALRLPTATGLRDLWSPFAIAVDSQRRIYVSDPDHARLDVFAPDGRWLKAILELGAISHLAIDCSDHLYAVIEDFAQSPTHTLIPGVVQIVDGAAKPVTARPATLRLQFPHNSARSDLGGRLHLPCANGTTAIFDAQGYPVAEKNAATLMPLAASGSYLSNPLDSQRRSCVWHRIVLAGDLPNRCRIDIQTTTSDVALDAAELADLPPEAWSPLLSVRAMPGGVGDALVLSPPGRYLWLKLIFAGDGRQTPKLARIAIEFPRVSLRRYLPGVFGMDPLAADFTDRFTAIFDTTLRSIERRIDTMHELFDASTAPAPGFLAWLGTWIGLTLNPHWPEATRRAMLKAASRLYTLRGTRYGLWQQLLVFLGLDRNCDNACATSRCKPAPLNCAPPPEPCPSQPPPLILEHFRLRRWLFAGKGKLGDDSMLWGSRIVNRSQLDGNARVGPLTCPPDGKPATQLISTPDPLHDPFLVYAHRFSVFVPARVKQRSWQRRGLERLLAQESPAHTAWQIEYVEPRFRVGVQAMVGLDSVIARVPAGMRLNDNKLGQGTVLPSHPSRPAMAGISATIGPATRLK